MASGKCLHYSTLFENLRLFPIREHLNALDNKPVCLIFPICEWTALLKYFFKEFRGINTLYIWDVPLFGNVISIWKATHLCLSCGNQALNRNIKAQI